MASPHICGLLAYYLSLQPASDSDYSLATITPKKLKDNLIKIATKGSLSDIPKDTPNLLAWNGGGCDNYSDIVKAGGYEAKPKATPGKVDTISELEKLIEHDFEVISGKVTKGASSFADKVTKFSQKIHEMVDEEIREFVDEVAA